MGRGDPPDDRDEDRALWAAVKATVAPIRRDRVSAKATTMPPEDKASPKPRKPMAKRRSGAASSPHARHPMPAAKAAAPPPPLSPGTVAGVDRRTADRLRRGKMKIDGRLDLHGMSREAAHAAVVDYLTTAHAAGRRCIVVVTGKGRGILKDSLPHWLNLPPLRAKILAIATAQPEHGGDGALYVLLKRRRDP